jgi:hypothetical protein
MIGLDLEKDCNGDETSSLKILGKKATSAEKGCSKVPL